jgi:hypothetical protein
MGFSSGRARLKSPGINVRNRSALVILLTALSGLLPATLSGYLLTALLAASARLLLLLLPGILPTAATLLILLATLFLILVHELLLLLPTKSTA